MTKNTKKKVTTRKKKEEEKKVVGCKLRSTLKHNVTLTYAGQSIIIPPRAIVSIENREKLCKLIKGITIIKS